MKLSERQEGILDILRARRQVEVEGLAHWLAVTSQTIRRDLGDLCDQGLAARTHGGARQPATVSNREYNSRRLLHRAEKQAIGALAASLITDHRSVSINIGTTTEEVASALSGRTGLMVLSNNINIINRLMGSKAKELMLVGGAVGTSDGAIVGEEAVEFISRYKVDFAVFGASALDSDGAILDFDTQKLSVVRAILHNAHTKICVSDASKFAVSAPVRICAVGNLDYFVTDNNPPAEINAAARRANTRILTVEERHEPGLRPD